MTKQWAIKRLESKGVQVDEMLSLMSDMDKIGIRVVETEHLLLKLKKSLSYLKNKVKLSTLKEKDILLSQTVKTSPKERVYLKIMDRIDIPEKAVPILNKLYKSEKPFSIEQFMFLSRKNDTELIEILNSEIYLNRLKKKLNEREGN